MKKILIASALLAALASCAKEENPVLDVSQKVPLNLSSVATTDIASKAAFEENAQVSIESYLPTYEHKKSTYVFARRNEKGEYDAGAPLKWHPLTVNDSIYVDHRDRVLSGYVPVNFFDGKILTNNCYKFVNPIEYKEELGFAQGSMDLCVETISPVTATRNDVEFNLQHKLSVLDFRVSKSANFANSVGKINYITFQAYGLVNDRLYSVRDFSWGNLPADTKTVRRNMQFNPTNASLNAPNYNNGTEVRMQFLMVPQVLYEKNNEGATEPFRLAVSVDGVVYSTYIPYNIPNLMSFAENQRHIFNLELTAKGLVVNGIKQCAWNEMTVNDNDVPYKPQPYVIPT